MKLAFKTSALEAPPLEEASEEVITATGQGFQGLWESGQKTALLVADTTKMLEALSKRVDDLEGK